MNAPTLASVHLGTPPQGYQEWATTKVHVHGFADLSAERDVPVYTPEFMALGNPWHLALYPGGRYVSEVGWVAIYLTNRSNESIGMNVGFSIKDGNGKQLRACNHQPTLLILATATVEVRLILRSARH